MLRSIDGYMLGVGLCLIRGSIEPVESRWCCPTRTRHPDDGLKVFFTMDDGGGIEDFFGEYTFC
jgi:hypothetical protein